MSDGKNACKDNEKYSLFIKFYISFSKKYFK